MHWGYFALKSFRKSDHCFYVMPIATLQRLDIMPSSSTSPDDLPALATSTSARQTNGASAAKSSRAVAATTNGQNGTSPHTNKRPRQSDGTSAAAAVNGSRTTPSGSRSASPLPPPLASRPIASTSNAATTAPSTARLSNGDIPRPSKKVKPEPQSSPNRMQIDSQAQATSIEQIDAVITPEQDEETQASARGYSPPPPVAAAQDGESQPSSASEFFNAPGALSAQPSEERRPTPSTSTAGTSHTATKAEAPSPRFPSLAQRTSVKLDSPMPSMSQSQSQNCKSNCYACYVRQEELER